MTCITTVGKIQHGVICRLEFSLKAIFQERFNISSQNFDCELLWPFLIFSNVEIRHFFQNPRWRLQSHLNKSVSQERLYIWTKFGLQRTKGIPNPLKYITSYINYSSTTKNNILFVGVSASRRKPLSGLTSESDAGRQFMQKLVPRVVIMVAPLVLIHVVGLPDPYRLPYESASFVWFSINHIGVRPVGHMILIAKMICNCRFVPDTGCPGLSCSSKDSCDAIHFFTMFFYFCSQWPSCFSNIDTFTVLHGIFETNSGFFSSLILSLGRTGIFLNVVCGFTAVQILYVYVFNIQLNASLNPFTYTIFWHASTLQLFFSD